MANPLLGINAGSGDDVIVGNAAVNYINGRDGDDRIWGGAKDDILEGGAGAESSEANGTRIDLTDHEGGTILLQSFDMANLDAADFLF